ncbi:hypothetical protein ABZT03_11185 [Streptomyces sp. NPDC005574]|uniref:hypothetical protein n=1 Tax=Streptomyces sp. NPDC005574 TaxID=3156891 RepID=UPI0033A01C64
MTRPAARRRFAVRAAAAAAVLLLAACSAGADEPDSAPAAPVTPARLTHTLPKDPLTMVLPATGAETRWTQGLDVFVQQVGRVTAAACARDRGTEPPAAVPLAYIRFFDVPDLAFVARHGLSESAEVPRPTASPRPLPAPRRAAARTARSGSVRNCADEGTAAVAALRDTYAPLQRQWLTQVAALRRDPAVARALAALPGCLAGRGVPARDEMAFMARAEERESTAGPAELPAVERSMGRTYATCMRPVEAVREPARLRLRDRFLTAHPDEAYELRGTLVPTLHTAERRYGLRLSFPAP